MKAIRKLANSSTMAEIPMATLCSIVMASRYIKRFCNETTKDDVGQVVNIPNVQCQLDFFGDHDRLVKKEDKKINNHVNAQACCHPKIRSAGNGFFLLL